MIQEVTRKAHTDTTYDILKGLANSASQQSPGDIHRADSFQLIV